MADYGKKFEQQFKKDWELSFPNSFIYRIPDQQSGYRGGSRNPCDFICYTGRSLFLIECKSHKGNTIPFTNLRQHDLLKTYESCAITGYICWFIEHGKVVFIPTQTISKMEKDGLKSININKLEGYDYIEIPSVKKRTFLNSDYKILICAKTAEDRKWVVDK